MVVNFIKKSKFILFLSFLSALSFQTVNSDPGDSSPSEPVVTIDRDTESKKISFVVSSQVKDADYTQTLAFLSNNTLRKQVPNITKLQEIFEILGKETFSHFIADPIEKELELRDNYYVFYHGQKREFLLIQDLFARLNELVYKKALKDFVMLRIPDNDHKKVTDVKQFLTEHEDEIKNRIGMTDHKSSLSKILLAVNPFLFGSSYDQGESAFAYFLNSESSTKLKFNIFDLAKNVFKNFNLDLNEKYETKINELIELLEKDENDKTGLLQQIFVPKKIIDEISYRCVVGGRLYHNNINAKVSTDLKEYQGTQNHGLLEKYVQNPFMVAKHYSKLGFYFGSLIALSGLGALSSKIGLTSLSEKCVYYSQNVLLMDYIMYQMFRSDLPNTKIDQMQFRILLDEDVMLNPESGVKIFRYCNETESVKEYKEKLDALFANISLETEEV